METRHQVVIVGGGLAALATAARLTELGVTDIGVYAAGAGGSPVIAAINFVLPENPYGDTPEQYREDMLHAGYDVADRALVENMTANTLRGYELLRRWGVEFAHNSDGSVKLRHVSGHTHPRSLCSTRELIGVEIMRKLTRGLAEKGVAVHKNCSCVKVLSDGARAYGVTIRRPDGALENVYGSAVVAAWGGVGNLFCTSTYPPDIKGNTLGMAKDAGCRLVDVEFLEFEPMVTMDPPGAVGEPCPTAMLGEGACLLNSDGERFLLKVRPQGEGGAPKSLINREIWKQVAAGKGSPHGGCWVDLRHIDPAVLKAYPWFYNRLLENGLDLNQSLLEVGPMAHSFSGGIAVDAGYQSSVKGLYAVGEACGGVHGACRCAGNAASQTTLSGLLCAEAIARSDLTPGAKAFPAECPTDRAVYDQYMPQARAIAAKALGIYRDGPILEDAKARLEALLVLPELSRDLETCQSVESMLLMTRAALARKESRGTHLRLDYPESDPAEQKERFL